MEPSETDEMTLRQMLREVEAQFDTAARQRGFDPAQAENLALPATLAKLFMEREQIKAQLEELVTERGA